MKKQKAKEQFSKYNLKEREDVVKKIVLSLAGLLLSGIMAASANADTITLGALDQATATGQAVISHPAMAPQGAIAYVAGTHEVVQPGIAVASIYSGTTEIKGKMIDKTGNFNQSDGNFRAVAGSSYTKSDNCMACHTSGTGKDKGKSSTGTRSCVFM